jgi:hypothetical protein
MSAKCRKRTSRALCPMIVYGPLEDFQTLPYPTLTEKFKTSRCP